MESNEQEPVRLAQFKHSRMIKRYLPSQLKNLYGNSALPKIFRLEYLIIIIPDKNTPPSEFLPDCNTVYTSGDTMIFSQSHPLSLITEHKHYFGLITQNSNVFLILFFS